MVSASRARIASSAWEKRTRNLFAVMQTGWCFAAGGDARRQPARGEKPARLTDGPEQLRNLCNLPAPFKKKPQNPARDERAEISWRS